MDRELMRKARWRQSSKRGMRGKTQSGKLTEKRKKRTKRQRKNPQSETRMKE